MRWNSLLKAGAGSKQHITTKNTLNAPAVVNLTHLILVEGRDEPEPHQKLEACAQAFRKVVIAAIVRPSNEVRCLCLMDNDLEAWIDLLQRLDGAHMVQVRVSHCRTAHCETSMQGMDNDQAKQMMAPDCCSSQHHADLQALILLPETC